MVKEGIDVTGIPGPNPMLGCGIILFVVGVVAVIAISGYLLFNASIILQWNTKLKYRREVVLYK